MHKPYKNFSKDHPVLNKLLHGIGGIIAVLIVTVVVLVTILSQVIGEYGFWR